MSSFVHTNSEMIQTAKSVDKYINLHNDSKITLDIFYKIQDYYFLEQQYWNREETPHEQLDHLNIKDKKNKNIKVMTPIGTIKRLESIRYQCDYDDSIKESIEDFKQEIMKNNNLIEDSIKYKLAYDEEKTW